MTDPLKIAMRLSTPDDLAGVRPGESSLWRSVCDDLARESDTPSERAFWGSAKHYGRGSDARYVRRRK